MTATQTATSFTETTANRNGAVSLRRPTWPAASKVVAFGQFVTKKIREMPKYGCINVHASLLPKYRGAGPIQWAVINGEKESGVTTMYMCREIDKGDMLLKDTVTLDPKETGDSLHDKLSMMGGPLLLKSAIVIFQVVSGIFQAARDRRKFVRLFGIFHDAGAWLAGISADDGCQSAVCAETAAVEVAE